MAGAVSALFLLDIKGRVLIWRDHRGDVSTVQAERFFTKLIEKEVVFLDVVESVNILVNSNGQIIRSDVVGALKMRTYLRAEFSLPSITAEEATPEKKAPIRVKFEIPYFTVSGIQVRYLKIIEKSGFQALPWVRYITMAGEYELRLI
ncbi:hypothetical protein BHE74_00005249 [Ensete ventricosum]|nr:hypothetical protein BHE74_00005249 [Ensete ventricosum]